MEVSVFSLSNLTYIISSFLFISGLRYLGTPLNAQKGNTIASIGMAIAVMATLGAAYWNQSVTGGLIITLAAIIIGSVIGFSLADRVKMTNMPQLVSLFNATGGGCAMLIGMIESNQNPGHSVGADILLSASTAIGAATFSGSIIAYFKLNGLARVNVKDAKLFVYGSRIFLAVLLSMVLAWAFIPDQLDLGVWVATISLIALVYGVLFVVPIGGADMPVVISLLNALTGVATGLAGITLDNKVMIIGGVLVGAAGVILTSLMCKSMNRSLFDVISGVVKSGSQTVGQKDMEVKSTSTSQLAMKLAFADKVGIVPGFGLAVAQAQHNCAALQLELEQRGAMVEYIIHPVAGRMPGHMNVLLAEAEIDYEKMISMDEANTRISEFDVLLIVGANDVVNPAAVEDINSPLHGMPIIEAHRAKNVVIIKRGMSFGYAGVPNTLFEKPNCELLFGEADQVLSSLRSELKNI
ncbi:MAG: NAD(P)(+) transhydrogenase (Re/Si-specific) subunit beta [Flavobacteriales bacterium]